jgi:hypothetical protein
MAAHYIQLDSAVFEAFLVSHGFSRTISRDEVVFEKSHSKEPNLKVKVYTSSRVGSDVARDVGKDAIRCIALFERGEKTYPIFKGKRIHRTTSQSSVQERTLDRINAAFVRCDEWLAEQNVKSAQRRAEIEAERAREQQTCSRSPAHKSNPELNGEAFGALREPARLTVKVVSRKPIGDKFLFTFQDDANHTFVYWSKLDRLQVDETYDIGFVVVGWNTFQGRRQTIIDNVNGKRVVQ